MIRKHATPILITAITVVMIVVVLLLLAVLHFQSINGRTAQTAGNTATKVLNLTQKADAQSQAALQDQVYVLETLNSLVTTVQSLETSGALPRAVGDDLINKIHDLESLAVTVPSSTVTPGK